MNLSRPLANEQTTDLTRERARVPEVTCYLIRRSDCGGESVERIPVGETARECSTIESRRRLGGPSKEAIIVPRYPSINVIIRLSKFPSVENFEELRNE